MTHFPGDVFLERADYEISKNIEIAWAIAKKFLQLFRTRSWPKEAMGSDGPQHFHAVPGVNRKSCMNAEAFSKLRLSARIRSIGTESYAAYADETQHKTSKSHHTNPSAHPDSSDAACHPLAAHQSRTRRVNPRAGAPLIYRSSAAGHLF
jgi:hypothetical protein